MIVNSCVIVIYSIYVCFKRAFNELILVTLYFYSLARIELFDGKGSLVEGLIERVDRTGLDFVAINDPIVVHPKKPQWDVFAAFGKSPY